MSDTKEAYEEAVAELKRVDHLFYVSLKYTRTVDMMKHMLERLIGMFQHGIEALLRKAKEDGKISVIPENHGLKANLVLEIYKDDELRQFVDFYNRIKRINRAPFARREEFRRHVTMIATLDGNEVIEINIDILKEHYETAKKFVRYVKVQLFGEDEY